MPYEKDTGTEVFGAQTFMIEVWNRFGGFSEGTVTASEVWLVPRSSPQKRVRLPVPQLRTSGSPLPFDVFIVSPDERVLFAARKVASGDNEVFLFHHTGSPASLRFRLADRVSLNERIGRKYGLPREVDGPEYEPRVDFVLFQAWEPGGHEALLSCHYGPRNKGVYSLVVLNTQSGRLSRYQRTTEERVLGLVHDDEGFPQTRLHLMRRAEVAGLSPAAVERAIDEMYARRGCLVFRSREQRAWLKAHGFGSVEPGRVTPVAARAAMFPTERANLALLMAAAKAKVSQP